MTNQYHPRDYRYSTGAVPSSEKRPKGLYDLTRFQEPEGKGTPPEPDLPPLGKVTHWKPTTPTVTPTPVGTAPTGGPGAPPPLSTATGYVPPEFRFGAGPGDTLLHSTGERPKGLWELTRFQGARPTASEQIASVAPGQALGVDATTVDMAATDTAISQELSQAEFDDAWAYIRRTGRIPPGAIRTPIDPATGVSALSELSKALLDHQEAVRIEGGYGADWERLLQIDQETRDRLDAQWGREGAKLTADQMFRDRVQTEAERAAEIQEAIDRANLGLSDRVWDPNALGGEGAFVTIPPDTLAQRQLTQRGTEATLAEEFRRSQLAEQVTAREEGYTQAGLAREQEADLAREAMGVAGPPRWDPDARQWISGVPDTLAQRQFDADIKARQRDEERARVAMGLGPTGTMDPSQTLASRQFELDRAFQEDQLALQQAQLGLPTETTYVDGMAIPGAVPRTLAQRQLEEQARQADIQAGIIEQALPFREFEEEQRRALEAEAMRRIELNIPLGAELIEALGLEGELDYETYKTGAQREAGRARTEAAAEALLARTSREDQASMQRDLEHTIAAGARGLTEREQDIQRDIAKIGLGLGAEGAQAIPYRQLAEQTRATRRGEALQQAELQGLIGDRETVAARAQTEAERAALIREGIERTQVFGGEVGEQGEFAPTLEGEIARAGLMGRMGDDPTLAAQQLAQTGEASRLNALVNIFQSAMQNPHAFAAMQAMGGGGAPFANLLAPLGFQMPEEMGQGAQQFFPDSGIPTMGSLAQADPEGLNILQALLGFSNVSPQQFGRLVSGITPGTAMRPAATTGMFRQRAGR